MDIRDRTNQKLTVVDGNNLVLKDNNFVVSGMACSFTATSSTPRQINLLATITAGTYFMGENEIAYAGITDQAITETVAEVGTYYVWVGVDSLGALVDYVTSSYISPTYDEENEIILSCIEVEVTLEVLA